MDIKHIEINLITSKALAPYISITAADRGPRMGVPPAGEAWGTIYPAEPETPLKGYQMNLSGPGLDKMEPVFFKMLAKALTDLLNTEVE
jgi:hypothetical protein